MPCRKISLDSSSITIFYDPSFPCRFFRWFRFFVDKFFVIIIAIFFHLRCCYLAYPFILSTWSFFLLSSSIFFRQTFLSSCCIFSLVFNRCIFLLIAMLRRKIPLHQRFSMILPSIVVLSADFDASSINSSKYLLNFFHIWCCCHLYLFTMAISSSLFLNLFLTNFSFFLLHFFVDLLSLHFFLITMPCLLFSTTLFYDVSVHYSVLSDDCDPSSIKSSKSNYFLQFFHRRCCCYLATLFIVSTCPRFFFFLPWSSFDNFSFFLFHFFHWSSFFCRCIVSTVPY